MRHLITVLLLICSVGWGFAQNDLERELNQYYSPDELVSLSEFISFDEAIAIISKVSLLNTGRNVVSQVSNEDPIGFEIVNMPYKKALKIIAANQGLIVAEQPDVVVVREEIEVGAAAAPDKAVYAAADSREVRITALFFEADDRTMREHGINWKFLLSGDAKEFGFELKTFGVQDESQQQNNASQQNQGSGELISEGNYLFDMGEFVGDAAAAFRLFEEEGYGEIIANPSITVRDKQLGRIQVGSDFSIKQRDFAGNVTDEFFSTGTIVEVQPFIYNEMGLEYLLLQLSVERSTAFPSEVSTEISKTIATTEVLMLNGEETVIGGLYVTDENVTRTGIPFLKDLPWWVLGIRYLTGSDQKVIDKKEIVIVIKAEILPTLHDRFERLKDQKALSDEQQRIRQLNEKYREQSKGLRGE